MVKKGGSRETRKILALIPGGNIFNEQKVTDLIKISDGGIQKMLKISKK